MTTKEIVDLLGKPGDQKNFVRMFFPFEMEYDGQPVKSTLVHQKAAPSLLAALTEILEVYGIEKIKELKINDFGGCFNNRPKRGTEERYNALVKAGNEEEAWDYLSIHAWAGAIDLNPSRNKLDQHKDTAEFAKPEYQKMFEIFKKHGWHSLGIEKNYDYMHLQFIKP